MPELERRLRRAAARRERAGAGTPLQRAAGAEPDVRSATAVRPEAAPLQGRPAAAAADEPARAPIPPDAEEGDQPAADAIEPLPAVEELANRIPAEARAVLEELFRAKWTEVKRLRPEDLRN